MIYTKKLNQALAVAAEAHQGQFRKKTTIPFITHPVAVMLIASEYTDNESVLIACLLHDVLEDVSARIYSKQQMSADFGDYVVSLVESVSESKGADDTNETPWKSRKLGYIEKLKNHSDQNSFLISGADKIHNIESILNDYDDIGTEAWGKFNSSKEEQLWFYQSVIDVINEKSNCQELKNRLNYLIKNLKQIA